MKKITKAKLGGAVLAASMLHTLFLGCNDPVNKTPTPTTQNPEPDTTPKAVLNLEAKAGVNRIDLSWELADDENRTGIRVSYDDKTANLAKDAKAYSAVELAGGVAVKFSVRALGADGKTSVVAEKEDAPDKSPQEKAVAEKAAFDTWIEHPDRKMILVPNVIEVPLDNDAVNNLKNKPHPSGFPIEFFETPHTFQDAKDDLAERSAPVVKAPAPKNKSIANQNRMAKAVVRNFHIRGA